VPSSTARWRGDARRGLTIVELLIALAIVGALTAIAFPQYLRYAERAALKQAVVDMRMLEGHIGRYLTELGRLPDQLENATQPVPTDPWGNPYQYLNLATATPGESRKDKNLVPINSDYDLYSKGADGKSKPPLTAKDSRDDVIRANNGAYLGLAEDY
jgi:general secretion pathway protein G